MFAKHPFRQVAIWKRLFQAGIWNTPLCILCGYENKLVQHCFWRCPACDGSRTDPDLPTREELHELPARTNQCGCFMQIVKSTILSSLCSVVILVLARPARIRKLTLPVKTMHDGRFVCWIDGACSNNQFKHLRRGGCGVFYAEGHPFNRACPLPCVEQTNLRAELQAVITSIET